MPAAICCAQGQVGYKAEQGWGHQGYLTATAGLPPGEFTGRATTQGTSKTRSTMLCPPGLSPEHSHAHGHANSGVKEPQQGQRDAASAAQQPHQAVGDASPSRRGSRASASSSPRQSQTGSQCGACC